MPIPNDDAPHPTSLMRQSSTPPGEIRRISAHVAPPQREGIDAHGFCVRWEMKGSFNEGGHGDFVARSCRLFEAGCVGNVVRGSRCFLGHFLG